MLSKMRARSADAALEGFARQMVRADRGPGGAA